MEPEKVLMGLLILALAKSAPNATESVSVTLDLSDSASMDTIAARGLMIETEVHTDGSVRHVATLAPSEQIRAAEADFFAVEGSEQIVMGSGRSVGIRRLDKPNGTPANDPSRVH